MPEGEPSQFDPNKPINEPIDESTFESVEPTTENEPTLEQLKDPKYWEQEFQRIWEQKAGQEKNWSGFRVMRKINSAEKTTIIGVLPNGEIIALERHIVYGYRLDKIYSFNPLTNNWRNVRHFVDRECFQEEIEFISSQLKKCQQKTKMPDNIYFKIASTSASQGDLVVADNRGKIKQTLDDQIDSDSNILYLNEFLNYFTSVCCGGDGLVIVAPVTQEIQIWSSPFYAGYWSEIGRDQELETKSIGNTLTKALDDITNMPLERIQGIQIDSAIKAFSERFPNRKKDQETWQNCIDISDSFRGGFESWREKTKTLPRPAGKPELSTETLPRPADRDEEDSSSGFPPARE